MRNLEHIDQIFSDRLNDYTKMPPARLWALIENELDGVPLNEKGKKTSSMKKHKNYPLVN
ncbi:MAG: hypothetical protein DRI88_10005 [Bacteroidetes bacterium]|nr:MAG: hypothetical protein DRI72_01080 [Bacteroidota bacterium]RLD44176.1 MAG: hypothetical protein DRI88_10005 [Bacteroidota bacterium]RLD73429.1 MAG: hypothetical protein DRI87_04010 [Bacteroidota bacterium]RLD83943.1 MAG: hypothetical protein DRJ02_12250 [Bacteroidota bacterium]HHL57346.1 hypothetical protein [Bacteroidota bacterium]